MLPELQQGLLVCAVPSSLVLPQLLMTKPLKSFDFKSWQATRRALDMNNKPEFDSFLFYRGTNDSV